MRIDLEIIKKIEFYLAGEMSPVERKIFEQEIQSSSELKEAIDQQKNLVKAMQKNQFKNIAINAAARYQRNRLLKMGGWVLGILVLVIGIYAGYSYLNIPTNHENNVVVQNSIHQSAISKGTENTKSTVEDSTSVSIPVFTEVDNGYFSNISKQKIVSNTLDTPKYNVALIKGNDEVKTLAVNHSLNDIDTGLAVIGRDSMSFSPKGDPYKIFGSFAKRAEQYTLSANKDMYIQGAEGTMIKIPAKSLVDKNQQTVKGDVNIVLIEFYKKSDIVLSNLHTMSNGKQLESGGMIYISIQQNGQELDLKDGKEMKILFSLRADGDGTQIFSGHEVNGDVNWRLQSEWQGSVDSNEHREYFTVIGSDKVTDYKFSFKRFNQLDGLLQSSTQLGWINCDRFTNYNNLTDLNIEVNGASDVAVRIVFKEINSVMAAYDSEGKKMVANVPVGKRVTIIAFTSVNEEPYFALKEMVITKEGKVTLDLQKTTMTDLEKELKKLN